MPDAKPVVTLQSISRRLDRVERRLRTKADKADVRRLERRFDAVDARLETLDKRFGTLERRHNSLEAKLDAVLRIVTQGAKDNKLILDNHERRLQDLETVQRPM